MSTIAGLIRRALGCKAINKRNRLLLEKLTSANEIDREAVIETLLDKRNGCNRVRSSEAAERILDRAIKRAKEVKHANSS
jgi:hypothetical protein